MSAPSDGNGHQPYAGLMSLLGQLMMIPFATMVYAMELAAETAREIERATTQGMEVLAGGLDPASEAQRPPSPAILPAPGQRVECEPLIKERTIAMSYDNGAESGPKKDLHDDMLKLVRYKILFVKREYEVAFPEQEDLVSENMDGTAFTAWKVAQFIQELEAGETHVPRRWADKNYPPADCRNGNKLRRLPEEDKKYLRVYFEVLERYPREKFKYEEQQIRVLEEIRDKLS